MGTTATRELASRARARDRRLTREVAQRDAAAPAELERRGRIKAAVAAARTALRTRAATQESARQAETRAAVAVRRVLDAGLSQADAAVLLGLSRSAVVRLARRAPASTGAATNAASTADAAHPTSPPGHAHGESSATTRSAANGGDL